LVDRHPHRNRRLIRRTDQMVASLLARNKRVFDSWFFWCETDANFRNCRSNKQRTENCDFLFGSFLVWIFQDCCGETQRGRKIALTSTIAGAVPGVCTGPDFQMKSPAIHSRLVSTVESSGIKQVGDRCLLLFFDRLGRKFESYVHVAGTFNKGGRKRRR